MNDLEVLDAVFLSPCGFNDCDCFKENSLDDFIFFNSRNSHTHINSHRKRLIGLFVTFHALSRKEPNTAYILSMKFV